MVNVVPELKIAHIAAVLQQPRSSASARLSSPLPHVLAVPASPAPHQSTFSISVVSAERLYFVDVAGSAYAHRFASHCIVLLPQIALSSSELHAWLGLELGSRLGQEQAGSFSYQLVAYVHGTLEHSLPHPKAAAGNSVLSTASSRNSSPAASLHLAADF
jgi:hypothetical protein